MKPLMNRMLARAWPLLVFLVAPLVIFPWHFVSRGMVDGGDDLMSNLPMLLHSARKLLSLDILWTSDCWLGAPMLGEPEYATFYLPRLVLLIGRPLVAFTVYQLGHYVLAQGGMYLYLRGLRVRREAAVVGALVYAFSGFMTAHRGHTLYLAAGAWAPVFLYFLHRSVRAPRRLTIAAACVSFAMVPFAGALQLAAYLATTTVLLFGVISLSERRLRPVATALLTIVPAFLISAVQILPSLDLSTGLAMHLRRDYYFNTAMSLHPAMLGALALPHGIDTEYYVRLGVIALALMVAGAVAHRRHSVVRGWTVVAIVALILAFGRYFPLVPVVLHALPLVQAFRGPVRHTFELSLAAGVLSAAGADALMRLRRFPKRGHAVWLLGGIAALVTSVWVGQQMVKDRSLPAIAAFWLRQVNLESVATAVILLALWLAISGLPWRGRPSVRVAALAVLVVGESANALHRHLYPAPLPDWHQALAATIRPSAVRGITRLLPSPHNFGPRSLAWNTALLFPGVQNVVPYASAAPRDFAELLNLDMHGFSLDFPSLRSSALVRLFGVTHIVMPREQCGAPAVELGTPAGGCTVTYPGEAPRTMPGACTLETVSPPSRWALDLRAIAEQGSSLLDVRLDDVRAGPRGLLQGPVQSLVVHAGAHAERHFVELDLTPFGGLARVAFVNRGDAAIAVHGASLVGFGDALATITPWVALSGARMWHDEYAVRLAPDGMIASVSVPVRWPRSRPETEPLLLDLVARAVDPIERDLVVDLFGGGDYDPDEAQIVIRPEQLSRTEFQRFSRVVWTRNPPDPTRVTLRAFTLGHGTVEIQSARLSGISVASRLMDEAPYWYQLHGRVESGRLFLPSAGDGWVDMPRAISTQSLRLSVRLRPGRQISPHGATVVLRDLRGTSLRWPLPVDTLSRGDLFVRTVAVPVAMGNVELSMTPSSELPSLEVKLADGCVDAPYQPEARIGSGLWLYRNERALPRVFTVPETRGVASLHEASALLWTDPRFAGGESATVEGTQGVGVRGRGRILDARFESTRVTVRVDATDRGTYLVVNDHFDPAWRATIDGIPVPIHRTNGLVRGVDVPAGIHTIVMSYRTPTSVWIGLLLLLVGFGSVLFVPSLLNRLAAGRDGTS